MTRRACRARILVFCLLAFLCPLSAARAEIKLWAGKEDKEKLGFSAESLWRYEMWDWFTPTGPKDGDYGYFFTRSRGALKWTSPKIDATIGLQYTQLFNTPGVSALTGPPQGPLGLGPVYFANTGERFAHSVFIKYLFADLKDPLNWGLSARIGRFDYSDGAEILAGDPTLDWLIKMRLSERLIGPFNFSAFTRSFDGGWAWWDQPTFRLDQLICHPTQGGFEERAGNTIEKIDLLASTLTIKKSVLIPNTTERVFFIRYVDKRPVTQRVDNTGILTEPRVEVDVDTYGMDGVGTVALGEGTLDGLFWGALQDGTWYELKHRAWAWTVEGGYQWKKGPLHSWKPWARLGYMQGSGDSNPSDTVHQTFFQVLPTARQYAFLPLYNLMNSNDLFAQFILRPWKSVFIRSDWHWLSVNDRNDRLYGGSGATQEKGDIFGYNARNTFGKADVGQLLDLTVAYDITSSLKVSTYYGHFFGGSVVEKIYPEGKQANFFFAEITLKF